MRLRFRKKEIILGALAIILVGPLLYRMLPAYLPAPDILYVKAKVIQVWIGNIYADPITGYDTMHPPLYYILLALIGAVGFEINAGLIIITIFNVSLLLFFAFKVVEVAFDRTTGFYTALMIPFIVEFMGCRDILLATSFHTSLPIYLAGIWIYFKSEKSMPMSALASFLWGIAFLLSPVWVFLPGLTFLYEALIKRRPKKMLIMSAAFLLTIIPFFVQAIYIHSKGLWGARVFSWWRGIPELAWHWGVIVEFISPIKNELTAVPAVIHLFILFAATAVIIRKKRIHWFMTLSLIAYFLTFYHFSSQYAVRIQVVLSIFVLATAISGMRQLTINRYIWIIPVVTIVAFTLHYHYSKTIIDYFSESNQYMEYRKAGAEFWQNIPKHIEEEEYIFCERDIYLRYVMPHFPAHALAAYKTMDYFQLKAELSDELFKDYIIVLNSNDYNIIDSIANKYGISAAVAANRNMELPLFNTLAKHWKQVYRDKYFSILIKPSG